jgi:NAD(P)-dependent dehydrogenase (short-subunit alcohol dehydrogenase family)
MRKVLLITGSSGIAAATAKLAAASGESVFVVGNRGSECEALSSQIQTCEYAVADVGDANQVKEAVSSCLSRFGELNAVFNVAGMSARSIGDGPIHECSTSAWQELMRVHAAGTFFVCREAVRHWLSSGKTGVVLNTSSVLARFPEREFFATHAYAASKGAIESMTLAAAAYYAPYKIRFNVLAPGLVRTPMSARAQANPQILSFIKQKQPLKGDLVEAEDIARIAYFLLSEESSAITGEIIRGDAGWAVTG